METLQVKEDRETLQVKEEGLLERSATLLKVLKFIQTIFSPEISIMYKLQ